MKAYFLRKYSASVLINKPKDEVWRVLDDFSNYYLWNTFTIAVKSDKIIGNKVKLTVLMKPGKTPIHQTEYLLEYEEQQSLGWGMNWWPFLQAKRVQRLSSRSHLETEYYTEDTIRGILCLIVHWLYGKHIQAGFERMALEMKEYLEKK